MQNSRTIFSFLLGILCLPLFIACGSDDNSGPPDPPIYEFTGEIDWVKTFGGTNEDDAVSVAQATDGGYVILSTTNSTDGALSNRSGSDFGIWLLKLDQNGEEVWSKTFDGTNDDRGTGINSTTDGGFIISGYSQSSDGDVIGNEGFHDYWVLKIDGSGNMLWNRNFGFAGGDQAFEIIQTTDGGYFVTGYLDVVASDGEGNDDFRNNGAHGLGEYWGIKLDANGNQQWRRYFGGTNNDRSYDVVQANDGGFVLFGAAESDDFDIIDSKGTYDFWAVKVSSTGEKVWARSFGGTEIDNGWAAAKGLDGNYIFAGDTRSMDQDITNFRGNADVFVVKSSDSNGGIIWAKTFGGLQFETARSVITLSNGNYVITGNTRSDDDDISSNNGLNDAWVFIIDNNGNMLYEKTIGGSNLDFGNDTMETSQGPLIMVGNTESNDLDIPQNLGSKDILIVKIK